MADATAKTLRDAIVTQADRKSYLMTDKAAVYEKLGREFAGHGTVKTGGFHHTNTVESFFALLKRAVYGNFHHVSQAHLHRYCLKPILNTTIGTFPMQRAARNCCAARRARGFCIDSLTKPLTIKQKARAFLRWRACRESE